MEDKFYWSRFIKTGNVEDYLMYKKSFYNKNETQCDGETLNEDEYGRIDTKGTEYW